jgi:hypothetical protein
VSVKPERQSAKLKYALVYDFLPFHQISESEHSYRR